MKMLNTQDENLSHFEIKTAKWLADEGHGVFGHVMTLSPTGSFQREGLWFPVDDVTLPIFKVALEQLGFILQDMQYNYKVWLKLTDGRQTKLTNGQTIEQWLGGLETYRNLGGYLGVGKQLDEMFFKLAKMGAEAWLERNEVYGDSDDAIMKALLEAAYTWSFDQADEFLNMSEAWKFNMILESVENGQVVLCDDGVYRQGESLTAYNTAIRVSRNAELIDNLVYPIDQATEAAFRVACYSWAQEPNFDIDDLSDKLKKYKLDVIFKNSRGYAVLYNPGYEGRHLPRNMTNMLMI